MSQQSKIQNPKCGDPKSKMRRSKIQNAEIQNPKSKITRVLVIEDDPGMAASLRRILYREKSRSFDAEYADRLSSGLERLSKGGIDIVLLDLNLPDSQRLDTLESVLAHVPEVPIVVLTGLNDEALATKALQAGAQDYLFKVNLDGQLLVRAIRYAIERKRAQTSLQDSEARFRKIIEKDADSIVIVNGDGIIRFVNPAAESFLGRKREELLGELFGFPLTVGKATEIDVIRKGGERAVAEMRGVEMNWDGEPAYLASLRDITEMYKTRKRAELLANLVENARHVMIFIVDSDGGIMECNALATSTFGYCKREMLRHNIGALFKPEADEGWEKIADFAQQESDWRGELVAVCKDGKEFPVDMAASRSESEDSKRAHIICFIRDVSREKEIDSMKSEFISLVSHEMRTPLASIKSALQVILIGKTGEITDAQEKFLSMAERNIDRLANLINDLLDISKIESGKMDLHHAEMDIRDCMENVVSTSRPLADAKSISLTMDIDSRLPPVCADASRIEQVMINLVGNAIKFTPEDGTVTVGVHEAEEMSDMPEGVEGLLDISVTDNGVGIPEELIGHIFDKFYQVKSPSSIQKQVGSGLGLAISKYIVEAHGGKIQCKSKEAEGSTFSFTLPVIAKEKLTLNEELCKARQQHGTLSVLILKLRECEHFIEVHGEKECESFLEMVRDKFIKGRVKAADKIVLSPPNGEILLLMPDTDSTGAHIAQKRIESYMTSELPPFTAGAATFPENGTSAEELVDCARKRLNIED